MTKKAITSFTATDNSAFEIARRKAMKGHKTWLLFRRKDGTFEGRIYCAAAIKAAMLEVGLRGRFWWFSANCGTSNICMSWGYGNHLLRCAKGWERHGYSAA